MSNDDDGSGRQAKNTSRYQPASWPRTYTARRPPNQNGRYNCPKCPKDFPTINGVSAHTKVHLRMEGSMLEDGADSGNIPARVADHTKPVSFPADPGLIMMVTVETQQQITKPIIRDFDLNIIPDMDMDMDIDLNIIPDMEIDLNVKPPEFYELWP